MKADPNASCDFCGKPRGLDRQGKPRNRFCSRLCRNSVGGAKIGAAKTAERLALPPGLADARRLLHAIKARCYRRTCPSYPSYGGRGIIVCDSWLESSQNFFVDMWPRPAGKTIDRKDNDGPYSPDNCRWSDYTGQARNTRSNVWIEHDGQRRCLAEWAEISGIKEATIRRRMKYGWPASKALTVAVGTSRRNAKLTAKDRSTIVSLLAQGKDSQRAIAKQFGVSQVVVCRLARTL